MWCVVLYGWYGPIWVCIRGMVLRVSGYFPMGFHPHLGIIGFFSFLKQIRSVMEMPCPNGFGSSTGNSRPVYPARARGSTDIKRTNKTITINQPIWMQKEHLITSSPLSTLPPVVGA